MSAQKFSGPSVNDPLGYDVWIREDMAEDGRSATGLELVSNAIAHRLTTEALPSIGAPGGWADYGVDVRRWCGLTTTAQQAAARGPQASEVIQRDERIETADVIVSLSGPSTGYTLKLDVTATTVQGQTISLVLGVSSVTVDILAEGQ